MTIARSRTTNHLALIFARGFAVVFLFAFVLGLPILVWRDLGWPTAITVLAVSLWLYLPGFRRAWNSIVYSQIIDADKQAATSSF